MQKSEDSMCASVSLYVNPKGRTQVASFGRKYFYWLSHRDKY